MSSVDPVLPLTPAELQLVHRFDTDPACTREVLLAELQTMLQTAAEVELATLPIYLYAYYSLQRGTQTPIGRFANQAGGVIMSVAVEEMLHMSLACNLLYACGGTPELYRKSPNWPTNLPGHTKLGPDGKLMMLPLAPFSYDQLWSFLEIEYPETIDATPEGFDWDTIGQLYSYIRCIIASSKLGDADFRQQPATQQLQPEYYAPNNIDTVYPAAAFDRHQPPSGAHSAASVARYPNAPDSHAGHAALISIASKRDAMIAIATICDQGEGFAHRASDDPSRAELSHYAKFLRLQAQLVGYPEQDRLPRLPPPPPPAAQQWGDLSPIVFDFPTNPTTASYPTTLQPLSDFCNGLYQYMLILTESVYRVQDPGRRRFFNNALHLSMIWMLDKLIQAMRTVAIGTQAGGNRLAPTFEDYDLGPRAQAYQTLVQLANAAAQVPGVDIANVVEHITSGQLPDVSKLWAEDRFAHVPAFPAQPAGYAPPPGAHACMGLNACKGQDRFGAQGHPDPHNPARSIVNDCAGQGYCATALDHTCHVKNACKGQGGCGLYGTAEEQDNPGHNACKFMGSCATPINAERFSTNGPNAGKSVWLRAREVFFEKQWPAIAREQGLDPSKLPAPPGGELFVSGPSDAWISASNCMTACGASKMSGAGSCG